ncbi:hypothetical protein [Glaciihabitans sp. UYNi722]|uniref:hypothetical protein n=1 Tax=Glaciihabitans sp. UYNi722 TaxID=3156344 RepID=UPI003399AB1E
MIPSEWTEYRRDHDDELLGYLVPRGDDFEPVTVFGYSLAEPSAMADAERVLDSVGLGYLADDWFLDVDGEWFTVRLSEASPERLRVAIADYGFAGDIGTRFELPVPVDGRLRKTFLG